MKETFILLPDSPYVFSNFSCLSAQFTIHSKGDNGIHFGISCQLEPIIQIKPNQSSNEKKVTYVRLQWCSTVLCIRADQGLS